MHGPQESLDLGRAVPTQKPRETGRSLREDLHRCAFPSHERMPLPIVHALARIKGAAARVNRNHGLDAALADAIARLAAIA